MDYSKIQIAALKAANIYEVKGTVNTYKYGEIDNTVCICKDYYAVFIPKSLYFLDSYKVFSSPPIDNIEKMFNEDCCVPLEDTHEEKSVVIYGKKLVLHKLRNGDEEIFIDTVILKEFGFGKGDLTFKGSSYKSPVYVYENSILLGLILPVVYRGE